MENLIFCVVVSTLLRIETNQNHSHDRPNSFVQFEIALSILLFSSKLVSRETSQSIYHFISEINNDGSKNVSKLLPQ